jgi:hypothetical protein
MSLAFGALKRRDGMAITSLRDRLRQVGFAIVKIDEGPLWSTLTDALDDAAALSTFRFPPIGVPPEYTPVRRAAFEGLFSVATVALAALLDGQRVGADVAAALEEIGCGPAGLFERENEPFSEGQAFSQSFFNLFNYNCGLLNAHADRSLLTVIAVRPAATAGDAQSALWVRDGAGLWRNADEAVGEGEVVILVGEDCEALGVLGLVAAEHAVRVDPNGDYVSQSHFRADPEAAPKNNRISAAFILRHEASM